MYMIESKYFQNYNEIIEPQTLVYISKICNFEENFDFLSLKVINKYYKTYKLIRP